MTAGTLGLALLVAPGLTRTESPPPAADVAAAAARLGLHGPTNAALRHFRAWGMTSTEVLTRFSDLYNDERELVPGWKPSAALRTTLDELEGYINLSLRAAQLDSADWGIEYADGWMALLPHLGKLRQEARVLEMKARVLLAGDAGANPEDRARGISILAAMFRLASHTRNDRTMISTLVGGAMARQASLVVKALADQGVLRREDAPTLLAALDSLAGPDPFNLAGCVPIEQHLGASLFTQTGPDAGRKAVPVAREMLEVDQAADDQAVRRRQSILARIEAMDEAALRADVARMSEFFTLGERALRTPGPDTAQQLAALEERVATGEFGVTVQIIAPSMSKAFATNASNLAELAEARAVLSRLK
ncbi:MAG: hypothetical protein AB7Q91_09475 [Phycisphaerales bacterium]